MKRFWIKIRPWFRAIRRLPDEWQPYGERLAWERGRSSADLKDNKLNPYPHGTDKWEAFEEGHYAGVINPST